MIRPYLAVLPALVLSACQMTEDEVRMDEMVDAGRAVAAGFVPLFDGETLTGWRGFKKEGVPDGWVVDDGCIHRAGQGGDLITEAQFESFVLELEWKVSEGANSGVFFHVTEDHDHVWQTGPEMQVLDDANHRDGGNPKTSAGSNYALHAPPAGVTRPVGEFNAARIVVDGAHVEHWLNGTKLLEYELWSDGWKELVAASKFKAMPDYGLRERGHIALQDHGDPVWFRNVRVKVLR